MSGWSAPVPHRRHTVRTLAAVVLACAALTGPARPAVAQPPVDPVNTLDDLPPLPPDVKRPAGGAQYRIADRDRAMFAGIADDTPLASEKENRDEYAAWAEVVQHARRFPTAELVAHGRRDLTRDDLVFPVRTYFRLDLIRFDGKLTTARRVRPTKELARAGLTEQYEARLVPADEPGGNTVCVVLTEWPAGLPELPAISLGQPAGESAAVDKWAAVGGYFFKLRSYPGPEADLKTPNGPGWLREPLLVGRSVTPLPGPPPAAVALDKTLRIFKLIRDDAPLGRTQTSWEETAAWNRVALHARKFTPAKLEAAANHDLKFADLFEAHRKDYQLDPVYFEGRLIRLSKRKPTEQLTAAGVPAWYEGWLVPDGEPRGNPVCLVLTDLSPGLEPGDSLSVPVAVAGYSFKLLWYESAEPRPDDRTKLLWKKAPLLIGHAATLRAPGDDGDVTSAWAGFVWAVGGGTAAVVGLALVMGWWYRRGDRRARAEFAASRQNNPFDDKMG